MVLLNECSCEAAGALDRIETIVGTAEFARLFGGVLTGRGIEIIGLPFCVKIKNCVIQQERV